ncbi:GSCOCG00012246001-RA-CDS, partial [Cotesia congregata]
SKYPLAWTEHLVYLLPKGDTGKFRPITLAPCFLKVMEKIVVDRTTWWLEHNNKIPDTQFGFRTGKSTADNLAVVVGDIYTGLAAGEFIITAFLDIKGAFDHVNPDILLQILVNTGIPTAYCLFFYYLIKQRKLYFVTNNGLTEPQLVNSGAGQGLVSAPLLFTLYTADEKLNLQLSPEKTKIIIFTHNDYNPRDISFTIKDVTVKPTTSAKFLGITLDQKLTFEDHYSNILTKINKVFPLIKSLCGTKWGAAPATLLNIYRALIRTKIEYGSHIMNAISSKLFSKLEKVQNKAIRTSMGLRISTPINSMMAEGGEIPLKIRLKDLSDRYTLKSLSTTNNPVINTLRTLDEYTIETFEKMTNEKYKNLTQVYTDASKSPDEPHVGVAIYNATLNTQLTFKINQQASATTAEALAILKAVEVALEMQEGTVIFSDSKNTLQSLLQLQDNKQRSYLTYKIAAKMTEAQQQQQLQVHLVWIPGHSGISGNETADRLAKEAVISARRTFTPIPFKDLANNSKQKAIKTTEEKLKEIGRTKGVLYFEQIYRSTKKPWFVHYNLPRKVVTTIIRMRLNHYNLNSS